MVITEANKLLKSRIPSIKESLSLYLANEETEHILFRPCRVSAHMMYYTSLVFFVYSTISLKE